ncbi:MAG: DUF4376 domain-containing protein [Clostridia bacterium]|nr:DUF4376 domain-containing protein [Clostridia bacterium]
MVLIPLIQASSTSLGSSNAMITTVGIKTGKVTQRELTPEEIAALPTPSLTDTKTAKLNRINDAKNTYLDGGFLHDGVLYDSDSKARLAYLEFAHKLTTSPLYSTPWKASTGQWVTMDAELFTALQPAYEQHISACFAWQAAREMEVAAAQSVEEVEAVSEAMS